MTRQTDWTTVRVSKATLASLERVRESMLAGDDQAKVPLDSRAARSGLEDKRGRIGLDRVIRRLIADRLRWQRRRRTQGIHTEARPQTSARGAAT